MFKLDTPLLNSPTCKLCAWQAFFNEVTLKEVDKKSSKTRTIRLIHVARDVHVKPTWLYFTSGLSSIFTCQIKRTRLMWNDQSVQIHWNNPEQDQWYKNTWFMAKGWSMIRAIFDQWIPIYNHGQKSLGHYGTCNSTVDPATYTCSGGSRPWANREGGGGSWFTCPAGLFPFSHFFLFNPK